MLNAIINYAKSQTSQAHFNPILKSFELFNLYRSVLSGLVMNNQILLVSSFLVLITTFWLFVWRKNRENFVIIGGAFFFLSFLIYIFLPIAVAPWHILGEMVAFLILLGFVIGYFIKHSRVLKIVGYSLVVFIIIVSFLNIKSYLVQKSNIQNDPSLFQNEINAIDYTYKQAGGKNFKAYVYLPSVIDYPYQYLYFWYGLKNYGYTPIDYAYLPNMPEYIFSKNQFLKPNEKSNSGLIFLIKEPDRLDLMDLWENSFKTLPKLKEEKIGPLTVEIRKSV